jgi:hypothetical protein
MDGLGTLKSGGYINAATAALLLIGLTIRMIPLEYPDFLLFVVFTVLSCACFLADRFLPPASREAPANAGASSESAKT